MVKTKEQSPDTVEMEDAMVVNYRCPVYHEPLALAGDSGYVGVGHQLNYPIVDGIPILLPDQADCHKVIQTDCTARTSSDACPLIFYNQTCDHEHYCREALSAERTEIEQIASEVRMAGPVLEIGSGKGPLQGIGGLDYVALDYSFTLLHRYIAPQYQRVCATADALPFADNEFRFLFSVASLEHVPNADLAFEEIHRVLRPGGIAYLFPAWHCVQYNCEGIPVRPYRDLTLRQKMIKLSLPVRQNILVKAIGTLPGRVVRRSFWSFCKKPARFRFKQLRPDYSHFWMSDSDASSRLDSHEGCLFFLSRGYTILNPGPRAIWQLLARHVPLVVQKPNW
jgi:SAM-dependent methyltransferase/uncharacterized protein YbaR (Trm112 family)